MHFISKKTLMCTAVAGALGLMALSAWAQEQAAPKQDEQAPAASAKADEKKADDHVIQEVQVTATRHSTSLLRTPVAVTAITQAALTRDGITDVRGLSGQVPNLQLSHSTDGSSGVQIAIRGVSNSDFTEIGNPAVGLHVGGLYSPRPQGALALLFDLDRLEILRGPQGTLFGRNSTGGSINIIPAKPEFGSAFGTAEVDIGNYNNRQISVVQNIPVSDSFAMRFTFMKNKRDGYLNQTQDFYAADIPEKGFVPSRDASGHIIPDVDQRYNVKVGKDKFYTNKDEWAGRLSARWKISKDLEWKVGYEKFQDSGAGDVALKDCKKAAGTPYACKGGQWDVAINVPGMIDMSIDTLRSGLSWNLSKSTTLEYNFARSDQRRKEQQDSDSGYQPLASQVTASLLPRLDPDGNPRLTADGLTGMWPIFDNATFTLGSKFVSDVHEVQLRGKHDTFRYVAGLFWMHEKNTIDFGQNLMYGNAPLGYPGVSFYHQPDRQSDSKAVFAQADWEFAPKWNFTLGGRLTRDTRSDKNGEDYECWQGSPCFFNGKFDPGTFDTPATATTPFIPGTWRRYNSADLTHGMGAFYGKSAFSTTLPDGPSAISSNTDSWNKFTWRLGLTNQMTPTDMVYSSISTGYKAGGFNDRVNLCGDLYDCLTGPPGPQYSFLPYKPETLTNYELGYKGKLLDKHLSLSATVFYSQYKDMQVTGQHTIGQSKQPCPAETPTCNAVISWWSTQNVGAANITGLEVEGEYLPWTGGHLGYSFSLLKAVVKQYHTYSDDIGCDTRATGTEPCPAYYPDSGTDVSLVGLRPYNVVGNRLPLAPNRTFNLSFSQDMQVGGDYTLTPWVSVRWQDKMYFSLRNLNDPHLSDSQDAYSTVDASIKLAAPNNKWHVEAYVRNLGKTVAKNSAFLGGPGQAFVMASYNDPRMFGIRVGGEW